MTDTDDIFEFQRLHDICMHEDDLERRFVTDLLRVAPRALAEIDASLAASDVAAVHAAAHALRGHSLMLGAKALGAACGDLEQDAKLGRLDRGRHLLARAQEELTRLRALLESFLSAA